MKNEENHADQVMNDDGLIKRIRLDSQDKEKNIQLEMERTVSDRIRISDEERRFMYRIDLTVFCIVFV